MEKSKLKIIVIIFVVFISGLTIGIGISLIEIPKGKPKSYISTEDLYVQTNGAILWNRTYLKFGYGNEAYLRFDLRHKPRNWEKCEISLYTYLNHNEYIPNDQYWVDIFEGNWTEPGISWEEQQEQEYYQNVWSKNIIYWNIERIGGVSHSIGFTILDITDYIKNNQTVSIKIYTGNIIYDSYAFIYPCEATVDKEYLPQLIWS